MAQEIERKFLVKNDDFKKESFLNTKIVQGFLSTVPERTVRIRIKGDQGFITVKGIGNESGTSRYEWEREISVEEATDLLKISEPGVIDKTRFNVKSGKHTFEVDEFYGDNEGLIIAEIELNTENELFKKPLWLGTEVTGDKRYYNSSLSKIPFKICCSSNCCRSLILASKLLSSIISCAESKESKSISVAIKFQLNSATPNKG